MQVLRACVIVAYLISSTLVFGQFKQITSEETNSYSHNRYSDIIYYREFYSGIYRQVNFTTGLIENSEFLGIPEFANDSQKAAFISNDSLYIKDFTIDSIYLVAGLSDFNKRLNTFKIITNDQSGLSFSIKDSYLLINRFDNTLLYTFSDSSLKELGFYIPFDNLQWSSDTTLLFVENEDQIVEYSFGSGQDTTLFSVLLPPIISFVYLPHKTSIVYSLCAQGGELHEYNLATKTDTVLLDKNSYCFTGPFCIRYLTADDSLRKIGFLVSGNINDFTGISYYDLDSAKVTHIIDCFDEGYLGRKNKLDWYKNEFLNFIWYDSEKYLRSLFSIKADITVDVSEVNKQSINRFSINSYPNPFNASTRIEYYIPQSNHVTIKIFDVLGCEIKCLINEEKPAGLHSIQFQDFSLPSGAYFCTIVWGTYYQTLKLLLLK